MPQYEVTLIMKPLLKPELIQAVKRACTVLLDHGAVIEEIQNLGFRDLPYRRNAEQTKEPIYTANTFVLKTYMPLHQPRNVKIALKSDLDLVQFFAVNTNKIQSKPNPEDCDFDEFMKPAVQRKAVKELRSMQKLGHFSKMIMYKRMERHWKEIPKAYPVAVTKK